MDREDGGRPRRAGVWREPVAWLACLLAAVMPTAVVSTIVQTLGERPWPVFVPALYIGLFTLMVLVVRPWTLR